MRYQSISPDNEISGTLFGVSGLPPRLAKESFVWNRPRAIRQSRPIKSLPLADAWRNFIDRKDSFFSWDYDSGAKGQALMVNMLADGLIQILPDSSSAKTVIAIDNHLPESRQESIIQSMAGAGIVDLELLWRPVALAISFLESHGKDRVRAGDQVLVVDIESRTPETTLLKINYHDGSLIPLRSAPRKDDIVDLGCDIYKIRRQIAFDIAGKDSNVTDQLCNGPFASGFIAFTENLAYEDVWCQKNDQFFKIGLDKANATECLKRHVNEGLFQKIKEIVCDKYDFTNIAAVLWHGWPFRMASVNLDREKELVMPEKAVSHGTSLYAHKLTSGLPTYLDTLPGLYILSEIKELKTYAFFHLVKPSVVEGGKAWRRHEPLTRFAVRHGIDKFTTVLRRSDEKMCRQLITALPQTPNKDTPVLIQAEMRPAHGHAQVTIEGDKNYQEVFGDIRRIKLDWRSMKKIEIPIVYAPEVYPVKGRLFDAKDKEYQNVLEGFLEQSEPNLYHDIEYRGHRFPFWKLMEPWGLKPPWHRGRGRATNWKTEQTRGMFGSLKLPVDKELIQRLAQLINDTVWMGDKIKFLNYMFIYTSDNFKNQLRDKFVQIKPSFKERTEYGRKRPSWNWVIAPGRVFSTKDDFEIFLDFMISHASEGYPDYPDKTFTQHYWWSFFRCLCYHEDTVYADPDKILDILRMIHVFFNKERLNGKIAKYCLCAILFSLRLRSRFPDFLQPGDPFCAELIKDIQSQIPRVPYPPSMLASVSAPHGEGLNEFVLRFLMQTASVDDFKALEGLTTSMA